VGREQRRESKRSPGRKLFQVPDDTFRVFVTSLPAPPEEIWRDDNPRAGEEQRLEELKSDLAADASCLQACFAPEAAFLDLLLLFNLRGEFQRSRGMTGYRPPASAGAGVPVLSHPEPCGPPPAAPAVGRRGGRAQRKAQFAKRLLYEIPTSRNLALQPHRAG